MAQAIVIREDQKASMTVGLVHSDATILPLGDAYHFAFNPAGIASLAGGYLVGAVAGTTLLHITDMAGTFAEDVQVTVTAGPPGVVPIGLSVVFGAPEPK